MLLVARLLPGWNTLRHTLLLLLPPRGVVDDGVVGVVGIDCARLKLLPPAAPASSDQIKFLLVLISYRKRDQPY